MQVSPARSLKGTIALPGDKSISHRAGMLASIANGVTRIDNYAASADCLSTLACMQSLGIQAERDGDVVIVHGQGKFGLRAPASALDCGNSGTTMRLLSGILAGQAFKSELTGDESLQSRPMGRVIEPLSSMGAAIGSTDGRAPLVITGRSPLTPIRYQPPVASAQIKSSVLLAGLYAGGTTTVIEPVPTRDHTERMLRWFGVEIDELSGPDGREIRVRGDAELTARDVTVPADLSAAAFFMIAAACLPGSEIMMPAVGINPSRKAVLEVLSELGADILVSSAREICHEPVAEISVCGGLDRGFTETPVLRGARIANLIDEIPIIAVLGSQLAAGLEVRDAAELRVKETDRIAAVVENLRRMGAHVIEYDDGFRVERSYLAGAVIDSFGDHRIAMAFAVAGLLATGDTEIKGSECAAVSFPSFFETLDRVVVR